MRPVITLSVILLCHLLSAQAPERMSFQAVVRDAGDALVTNATVGMRISILQGSPSGGAVYVETHAPMTNANGLVSLEIGGGLPQTGSMASVDWSAGPYFIKTETDPLGGAAYSITGTQQLLSVPYALFAANGGGPGPAGPPGAQGPAGPAGPSACEVVRTADGRAVVYTTSNAYGYGRTSTGASTWVTTAINGPVLGAVASDTLVVLYTATHAYVFGPTGTTTSTWVTTALNGTPLDAVASTGRVVVYTTTNAYGAGRTFTGATAWDVTAMSGTPVMHQAAGNRVIVCTTTNAYGYGASGSGGSGWSVTALSGIPEGVKGSR
ncbi:MAG: hypothetical protein JNM31_13050 [Flavobacteriales bacterium]|nr:hypothetical protein [Flavobacteriales bacterium]